MQKPAMILYVLSNIQ